MKTVAVALLACMSAFALDNSSTIHHNFTGALTNHPVWFGKWFREGEIPNYCRPYATPSDTGTRAAATSWQCEVLTRWRDASVARTITSARTGDPAWSTGGGGLTNIVVAANRIATMTTAAPHNLVLGDRLVITGTPADADLVQDNYVVHEVTSTTQVKFVTRNVGAGTYSTNFTATQAIDPMTTAPPQPALYLRYTSANHGFYKGEQVTCSGVGGITGANGTFTITGVSRNEFVVNAAGSGTYTSGGTCTGPDNGSVQHALVALKTTIPASGSTRIDFIDSANPSSAGNVAATRAAGFDKTAMLAETWNGQLVATADVAAGSTAAITTDARTMLTAWGGTESDCGPRYWTIGPVLTQLLLEFGCQGALTYDFGWKIMGASTISQAISTTSQTQFTVASAASVAVNTRLWMYQTSVKIEIMTVTAIDTATTTCNGFTITLGVPCLTVTRNSVTGGVAGTYATGARFEAFQWQDATDPYKSLHPRFQLRFVSGWSGVGVELEVKNEYFTKMQSQWYAAVVKTGGTPATRWSVPEFKHANRTSWDMHTWDGDDPEFYCQGGSGADPENCATTGGGTRARKYWVDHNTPYLIYSRFLPQYQLVAGASTSSWLTDAQGYGFAQSDKGAVGVLRSFGGEAWPGLYLGDGTWGVDPYQHSNDAIFGLSSDEEGGMLETANATWVQSWDLAGYELMFGTSTPGGGGNAEAQMHMPYHSIESDEVLPRMAETGFTETGFGSNLALTSRWWFRAYAQSYTNSATNAVDRPQSACGTTGAPLALVDNNNPVNSASMCSYMNAGMDKWDLTSTTTMHMNDWLWLAYMTTANPRYLEGLQSTASWVIGSNVYRLRGAAITEGPASQIFERGRSWTIRSFMRALVATPNVPQFGATAPGAWKHYFNNRVWELVYGQEGFTEITDGHFFRHYPYQGTSCTGYVNTNSSLWKYGRCTANLGNNSPNPLGWPRLASATGGTTYPWVDYRSDATWMIPYSHVQQSWFSELGTEFQHYEYIRRKQGALLLNLAGNATVNPFRSLTVYQAPGKSTLSFLATWAEYWSHFYPSWVGPSDGLTHTRDEQTWAYGSFDSTGPIGYPAGYLGALSFTGVTGTGVAGCTPADRPPAGCTQPSVYQRVKQIVTRQNELATIPKYAFIPRQTIGTLTVAPGGTTAVVMYTAPTGDACTYAVGASAFTDSLDGTDASDGGGGLLRRVSLTGLSSSSAYYFRLTCGARLSGVTTGTTRASTTFTTVTQGGPTTLALTLGGMPGASTATVEYGDTSSLGNTLDPAPCNSGCAVSVPATERKLLYYRATYRTAEGATLASGSVLQAIPQ